MEGGLQLEWRSFLLRPSPPETPRPLERFRAYTESWRRAAAEEPRAAFRVWQSDEGPPSHSLPPHLVSKAAERIDRAAWERLHWLLLEAYFRDNRDITATRVLRELWLEADLPEDRFDERLDESLAEAIVRDHNEALEAGASGVPAARLIDHDTAMTGALPVEVYRRWIGKAAAAVGRVSP